MANRLFIFLFLSIGLSQNVDSLFMQGTSFLETGRFEKASALFETILNQGYFNGDLYYNLGNSYYRSGNYGHSIWAYEKAVELNPLDGDAKFNLALVNTHVKDRIHVPETFFLLKWYRFIKSSLTFSQLLSISALFVLLSSIYYLVIKFIRIDFSWVPFQIFLFSAMILHGILLDKYWDISEKNQAIITDYEVEAFSGPFVRSDAVLFKIHEGIKVSVDHDQGDWVEISLMDGKKGWIKTNQLRFL
ncbi:MAG: tetratricopeptide repeat protein [Candidatus Marinimicrobia bacterium]|nr:tetratricopeptide repeat protein [Candidatus Neomarinimicrobiota bacterium]